jgi:hypothetical protein
LLQLLTSHDGDDPAADPLEYLGIQDVPVLNQLSDLHFGTSIRATRDAGLYYLQLSLRLGALPMLDFSEELFLT